MAVERIKLFEADIDIDGIIKKSSELKTELERLRSEQKALKDSGDTVSEAYVKLDAKIKNVSREFRLNQQQVSNLTNANNKFLSVEQKITAAINEEIRSIEEAVDNNKELRKIRNSVNAETEEGQKIIVELNKKIDENTAFIKANTDSYSQQKMNIGDYKTQIIEAAEELNIFNGGLGAMVQRAESAGGVLPMMQKGLTAVTSGVWGMTKASLAFIATPIGAVIAAVALVLGSIISYLKGTQEGIDKVTAVTRPLMEVFKELQNIVNNLGGALLKAFTDPIGAMKDIKDQVMGIGDAMDEAWRRGQRLDEVLKGIQSTNLMISASESIFKDALLEQNKIYRDRSKSAQERMDAAEQILNIEKSQSMQKQRLLKLQLEELEIALATSDKYEDRLAYMQAMNALKEEERRADEIEVAMLSRINNIRNQAERERAEAESKRREEAERIFSENIKRQEEELALYLASQSHKKKTMSEELKQAEETSKRLIAIKKTELENKKISEAYYQAYVLEQEKELAKQRALVAVSNYEREFEEFKRAHQTKLEQNKFFSQALYEEEQERLQNTLEREQILWDEKLRLGVINQDDYNRKIDEINDRHQEALDNARLAREQAEAEKRAIDLENIREARAQELEYDLEFQLNALEMQRQQEIAMAEKTGADIALIEEKYAKQRKEIEAQVQENKIELMSMAYGDFSTILGKESSLGKAAAVMQTTIDTYQSAVAAYKAMAGIPVVGPGLAVAASGAAIAKGIANVKKITAAKLPKAEKGISLDIGGKRHSSGGTKFYGEDGTAFEAERGERMFVLNRRASAALGPLLSDINQSYGGISLSRASSYLASGGQVMRGGSSPRFNIDWNLEEMKEAMYQTMRDGSRDGAREGSSLGTYSGLVDRQTNEAIAAGANF